MARLTVALILAMTACTTACTDAQAPEAERPSDNTSPAVQTSATPTPAPTPTPAVVVKVPHTECTRDERPIFICTLKNGKLLNVCATTDPASPAKAAFAQYRVGKRGAPAEIAIPKRSGGGLPTFASVPYSGGGEAQMSFADAGYRYIVFSRVIRTNFAAGEPNNPDFEDGVMVVEGAKPARILACAGEARKPLDYNLAAQFGTKVDDIYYPE